MSIKDAGIYTKDNFVVVTLLDKKSFLQNATSTKSKLTDVNDALGYGDLAIPVETSDYSAEEVCKIMQAYYKAGQTRDENLGI